MTIKKETNKRTCRLFNPMAEAVQPQATSPQFSQTSRMAHLYILSHLRQSCVQCTDYQYFYLAPRLYLATRNPGTDVCHWLEHKVSGSISHVAPSNVVTIDFDLNFASSSNHLSNVRQGVKSPSLLTGVLCWVVGRWLALSQEGLSRAHAALFFFFLFVNIHEMYLSMSHNL